MLVLAVGRLGVKSGMEKRSARRAGNTVFFVTEGGQIIGGQRQGRGESPYAQREIREERKPSNEARKWRISRRQVDEIEKGKGSSWRGGDDEENF